MPNKVYINGRLVPERDAKISIYDRAFLYGEGAFETLRAYSGKPLFADLHYHRLLTNCQKLKIELPFDEYEFKKVLVKTIVTNHLKEAYVRVTVSSVGPSVGLARPKRLTPEVVIFCKPFEGRPPEVYERGAMIVMVESAFADDPITAEIKSTSYITKMLARMEITEKKADEGLLINRGGFVTEGSATNLFIVKGGTLITPPLTDGVMPGITRWAIMGIANGLNMPCREAHIRVQELVDADEILLTGSTTEVMPIREVSGLTKKIAPGPVTRDLMREYKRLIREMISEVK